MPRSAPRPQRDRDNLSEMQQLETRQLMSAAAVALPYKLDFSATTANTVIDKDGQGTGFTGTQAGTAAQVDINTAKGTLALTADYSSSKAAAALETAFDGTTRGFTITARLVGPLSNLLHASDQTGIYFGPDQNNCVKLTAIYTSSGERLQFTEIVNGKSIPTDSSTYITLPTKFASITTLDLQLTGDAVTGNVTARYSINAKSWTKVATTMVVPTANLSNFFNSTSKTGVLMSDKHGAVTATFDSFQIEAGLVANVPVASLSRPKLVFSDLTTSSNSSTAQTIRVYNTGSDPLTISGASITGDYASEFTLTNPPTTTITIAPGSRYDFYVTFKTGTANAIHTASLAFTTNDTTNPVQTVSLRGLGLAGQGGSYEPSLQRIIDLYQIPINTGETDTNDNSFPVDTATANSPDEVAMQQIVKSGTGPVTVELLGVFANQVSATSFGWYEAGNSQTTYKVASVAAASAQSVSPLDDGALTFDPGSNSFGIYGNFTLGSQAKPLNRNVYSESALNGWETNVSRQKKVRFYQLKDASGNVVPNAYVFAFEEYNVTFDQNDIVGIIRNVQPAAAGPEIGLENLDAVPAADQLVMSRVEHLNADLPTQTTHDTSTVRVWNTGTQPLNITQMVLADSNFQIVSGGGAQTVAAGKYVDVKIAFVYSNPTGLGNKLLTSTLKIYSNDSDEPIKTVKLSGVWQSYSENQPNGVSAEPTAETVIQAYGYGTTISTASSPINTHGVDTASGDEVLSQTWQQADTGLPVTVRMLATYHQVYDPQWNTHSTLYTYDPTKIDSTTGKPIVNKLLSHEQEYSQSLLPTIDGSMTAPAVASWVPTSKVFGFNIDGGKNGTYSQDIYNTPNDANNPGHGWRFYVAKDASGNIIPDTYIACQDYVKVSWANYDYQDNILLITNVKPVQAPQTVQSVKATSTADGVAVAWKANTANDVTGYNVYRQLVGDTTWTRIATNATGTSYSDTTATTGQQYTYYVTAQAYQGGESAASATSTATAGTGTISAPTTVSAVTATATSSTSVTVAWTNTGSTATTYRIERKTAAGTYAAVGTAAAGATSFTDTTAVASTTYTYRVFATNTAGDSAASNEATVATPAAPTTPTNPTNPTTPVATALTGIDIGAPTPAGKVTTVTTGRDYDVAVGGVDIYGTADRFNYLYEQKTGNFDVAVQITALAGSDPSTQAGLMVRDGLAAGAKNIEVKERVSGLRQSYRSSTGGSTVTTGTGDFVAGTWLRMQRTGNVFNSYTSSDGQTWTLYSSVTMSLSTTLYVGLATCGHSQTTAGTASYRNFGDTGSTTTTPVTTAPAAATNLAAAIAGSGSSVALTWTDNATNETGYRVERQNTDGTWSAIATLAAASTTYTDTGVFPSTTYAYRVFATGSVDSPASNTASVTTPGTTATPIAGTLTAVADTYVYDGATTTSYGSSAGLQIKKGSTGYNRQAYIKFDISSLTSLTNAKLRLYTTLNTADSVQFAVYGVTSKTLSETTTTYANKPTPSSTALGTGVASSISGMWIEIDLSAYVKAAVAAGQTSITLNLAGTGSSSAFVTVASRESGANAPQLVVA